MIQPSIALALMIASSASPLAVHGYSRATATGLHMTARSPSSLSCPDDPIVVPVTPSSQSSSSSASASASASASSRRRFMSTGVAFALGGTTASLVSVDGTNSNNNGNLSGGGVANAVGPIKINIINPTYTASPCPKDKPIPGEKAMKGMRGLCVQVKGELEENSPKVRVSLRGKLQFEVIITRDRHLTSNIECNYHHFLKSPVLVIHQRR
jgi:hypothetical protein